MAPFSYVAGLHDVKESLRLSPQAIKRAVLALTLALCVAGVLYFGYGYFKRTRLAFQPNRVAVPTSPSHQ
jgi:hypothetical protein